MGAETIARLHRSGLEHDTQHEGGGKDVGFAAREDDEFIQIRKPIEAMTSLTNLPQPPRFPTADLYLSSLQSGSPIFPLRVRFSDKGLREDMRPLPPNLQSSVRSGSTDQIFHP